MSSTIKHVENKLFHNGIQAFNEQQFYDAHEILEELWSEHKINDRIFIQGLIQVAVAFYHLKNNNLNGAKSMLKKALKKIDCDSDRVDNLPIVIMKLNDILKMITSISVNKEFNWSIIPKILIKSDEE